MKVVLKYSMNQHTTPHTPWCSVNTVDSNGNERYFVGCWGRTFSEAKKRALSKFYELNLGCWGRTFSKAKKRAIAKFYELNREDVDVNIPPSEHLDL